MGLKQALITYSDLKQLELDGFYVNWAAYWFQPITTKTTGDSNNG